LRKAFTLIELVIVILILGILAGVAAPKMFNVSDSATDNGVKESLTIVRDAIDRFTAASGTRPGADGNETTFKSDLTPYVRHFPVLPVGPAAAQDDAVLMSGGAGPPSGEASPTEGWKYYFNTGDFIINVHEPLKIDGAVHYDEL
jgi:prepilin-type N-terminal cleavage/methylation domain-containing protein